MQRIDVTRRTLDAETYKLRTAIDADCASHVTGDFELYEDGVLRIVYIELPERLHDLTTAMLNAPVTGYARTSGLKACSATFGYMPRHSLFHDYCKISRWDHLHQQSHRVVMAHAPMVERYYAQYNPEMYARHKAEAESKVLAQWRMGGSVFTSGIVNKNTPLAYHYDSGNFKDVWSCMLAFKRGINGGDLSIPEYDITVKLRDRSLIMFDGQSLLHGVTPIHRMLAGGYRYTAVFYSIVAMWQCRTPGEELARVRGKRDAMESKRLATEGKK